MTDRVARQIIAYADHATETGGAEVSLALLLEHLDRDRFRPVVFHAPGAEWLGDPARLGPVELVAVFDDRLLLSTTRDELDAGTAVGPGQLLRASRLALRLAGQLVRKRVALVHTNTLKCHILAGIAGWLARRPVVWHMRDIVTEPGPRRLLERVARLVRPTVIAISGAVAQSVEDLAAEVEVIYNGVDLGRFRPGPPPARLYRELDLTRRDRVLMIVARLTPWKGHRELLRAMPTILSRFPDARLVVVGAAKFWHEGYLDELKRLAEELSVAHAVRWAGHRGDVHELLRLCEVFVLPSRDEPFGRAIVEAMAMGRPVVAGRAGAVPEICPHGECGLLVEPTDPAEIAAAVCRLLAAPDVARAMGERGRRRALEKFDAAATAAAVQALYERVLGPAR